MSKLLLLYPRAWRRRYEDEFLALLEDRPLTAADLLDIVRGALDAHYVLLAQRRSTMGHKFNELLLRSLVWRTVIIGIVTLLGVACGMGIGHLTPSVQAMGASTALWVGVGCGLFLGFVCGAVWGIMRVLHRAEAQRSITFPTGVLEFHAHDRQDRLV